MSVFKVMPHHSVTLHGILGDRLHKTVVNRLLKIHYPHLVDVYRYHSETDNLWRCEFWGKIVRSAIWCFHTEKNPELEQVIRATVEDMISTQSADGCISAYPPELQLSGWDIWGRKYVMIALLRYYEELDHSERVKEVLIRMLDHLIVQLGEKELREFGCHSGLAACSILGAVVGVYRISGEKRFLDFAASIVRSGCCTLHNIFEEIRKGRPVSELSNGKAYEMMSCFQGLADYCNYDPREEYKEAVLRFFEAVRTQEIFITGGGGALDGVGEFWYNGRYNQTRSDVGAMGETCVTVTYMHLCNAVLGMTELPCAAAEFFNSFCNALLGAVRFDGRFWCHGNPTPLAAGSSKIPAIDQIAFQGAEPFHGHDCCLAQGPEGIALAALNAVMRTPEGIVLHYFEEMEIDLSCLSGKRGYLKLQSSYPFSGRVDCIFQLSEPIEFELKLLIPFWQPENLKISVNGEIMSGEPGKYFAVKRVWHDGDRIEFELDFSLRKEISPDGKYTAFLAGPLVMSRDSRLSDINAPVPTDLQYEECPPDEWNKIFLIRKLSDGSKLCDYISAGSFFQPGNLLRVWLEERKV